MAREMGGRDWMRARCAGALGGVPASGGVGTWCSRRVSSINPGRERTDVLQRLCARAIQRDRVCVPRLGKAW